MNLLSIAEKVERSYNNINHANQISSDILRVREALIKAIQVTHPKYQKDIKFWKCSTFINQFSKIFSLNYDLLLYWANLDTKRFRDGFGYGKRCGNFIEPFNWLKAGCNIYNIHGGLHLFKSKDNSIKKALKFEQNSVITTITDSIKKGDLPLYIAEGTSQQKYIKIRSNNYLSHCYSQLQNDINPLFIYGHSADESDAHIYQAIFYRNWGVSHPAVHLYFGVYEATAEKLRKFTGLLDNYRAKAKSSIEYTFFRSESADVWDIWKH